MSSNTSGLPTVQSSTSPSSAPSFTEQPTTDDVIDLRVYLDVLVRWWREIFLIGLLFGLIAGGIYLLLLLAGEDVYESAADVAILRTVSEVTLDERFVTSAENPVATTAVARRNALIALAENPALANVVIAELGDALPEDLQNPAMLAAHVGAEMGTPSGRTGDSDLIRITASTTDPALSAQIATSWAQAFVRTVNQVYGQVPDELFTSISREQDTSRVNYESAQRAYEEFLARSRVDEIARTISDKEVTINTLRRGRNDLLSGLVNSAVHARTSIADAIGDAQAQNLASPIVAEQEGKRDLVKAYIDTVYQGQQSVISQQGQRDRQLLQDYYTRWVQVNRALGDAQALRDQTQAISDSSDNEVAGSGSSALVLSLLKLQAFSAALDAPITQDLALETPSDVTVNTTTAEAQAAAAPGLVQSSQPVQVQVGSTPLQIQLSDATTMTNAEIVIELDTLVDTLTQRRDSLQSEIEALSTTILDGSSIQTAAMSPTEGTLARSVPSLVASILGSSIITTTTSALNAASTWEIGELAALYNTADLQGLAIAGASNDQLATAIADAEAQVRAMKAELEAERTTQNELTLARDLAQDAYRAANSKKTELTLARAGAGGELRFAAPAVASLTPVSSASPLLVAVAATMAGLVFGVIYAFVADAMGKRPFLSRRRHTGTSTLAPA